MPFPTEFPSDAAKTIGAAILAKKFDATLLEPAYDLQGYAEYMLFGGGPFPKPVLKSTPEPELDDHEVARRLVVAAESEQCDEHSVRAMPIPWATVLSIVLTIIQKFVTKDA